MNEEATPFARLGAVPSGGGHTAFRVWAPNANRVAVRLAGREHELVPLGDSGVFAATILAPIGSDYLYVLDGEHALPDPCSRFQATGVGGPSRIVDCAAFRRAAPGWAGISLESLVVYELHVGAFSQSGTFDGVIERLPVLRELGITAIELMPIATFPGNRNWGYDGVYSFAPHAVYGGPEGFVRLVQAAHREGIGVILDVVYNHLGPGAEAISAFGPYLTNTARTFWGDALDYSEPGVREWAIQNAELWVRDYQVDGLRLDATHAIHDEARPHVLAELARRVRAINPHALIISEMETGDLRPIEEWGHDAQWADEFHHLLHVLLTDEQDGYYGDYSPSTRELAKQYTRTPARQLVYCSQNHDQVGNRALGDRPQKDELRLRAAALLFAPQTPLLFMGEEYGEQQPFQFFTDHTDAAVAEAVREGRKREFEHFTGFTGDVPDPQDPATFERSKLHPERGDSAVLSLYKEMLALRRALSSEIAVEANDESRSLRAARDGLELRLDFVSRNVELRHPGRGLVAERVDQAR